MILEENYYNSFWGCSDVYLDCVSFNTNFLNENTLYSKTKNYFILERIRAFSRVNDVLYQKFRNLFQEPTIYTVDQLNYNSSGDFVAHRGLKQIYKSIPSTTALFSFDEETILQIKKSLIGVRKTI